MEFDLGENDDLMMEDLDDFDIDLFCDNVKAAPKVEVKEELDFLQHHKSEKQTLNLHQIEPLPDMRKVKSTLP